MSSKKPYNWNGIVPCGSGISQFLTDPTTNEHLRYVLGYLSQRLTPFMNGHWSADGTGIGFRGDFRMIIDVKKKKTKNQNMDDPAMVETLEYDSIHQAQKAGHDVTWERGWKMPTKSRDYKRVVVWAAHPYMIIGDVQVFGKHIGERAAVEPGIGTIKGLGLPFDLARLDGGFNSSLIRDAIISAGARPIIPYPRHAVNAYNPELEDEIKNLAELEHAFAFWKESGGRHFETVYSPRSMIENVFSCIKARHPRITTMKDPAPENEILLWAIEHNIIRFLQLFHIAGIPPKFITTRPQLSA